MSMYLSEDKEINVTKFDYYDWFETDIEYNYKAENSKEYFLKYTYYDVINNNFHLVILTDEKTNN